MDFVPFPKIPRISRNVVITEKIDGTNAQIVIEENTIANWDELPNIVTNIGGVGGYNLWAGSRNRYVTPGNDNFGFATWVRNNAAELVKLGVGQHYGEWWGLGIQRGYDLKEKRFSLFNAGRWNDAYKAMLEGHDNDFPKCCHVVPTLSIHTFDVGHINEVMAKLRETGSQAAPGYMNPEGIIIYHTQARSMYKKTYEYDDTGKGD
jgi:hypothetical protein